MYDIHWDVDTGGILLSDSQGQGIKREVRPVFYEELDLLGFNNHWEYPCITEPLLWATSGRKYYYRGELVAEAKGGGLFTRPQLQILHAGLKLAPVNVKDMLSRNSRLLQGIILKSLSFICNIYDQYREKIDITAVAFSGGKDSIVTLDLAQRALEPGQFVVIFGDTGMEIADTYRAVEASKKHWPHLNFYTACSNKDALTTWREFGPPSRIHRWCCAVHKSAPTLLLLSRLIDKPLAKALIFDGVRREESPTRSTYNAVTQGGKHKTQTNASPIIAWNSGEVFLYLLKRGLMLNDAYRYGIARVGCAVCPMASNWREMITEAVYQNDTQEYIGILKNYAQSIGVNHNKVNSYIEKGYWKARAGGRYLSQGGNKVFIQEKGNSVIFTMRQPSENWQVWAKTLGCQVLTGLNQGFIERNKTTYHYKIEHLKNSIVVQVEDLAGADRDVLSAFRSVAFKSTYCCHCQACQADCPIGALTIGEKVQISGICTACGKCLDLGGVPCYAAKSLITSEGGMNLGDNPTRGLSTYQTFGIRKTWVDDLFRLQDNWLSHNDLGNRQLDSMLLWLRHAEMTTGGKKSLAITNLTKTLAKIGVDSFLTWAVIWTNLARNSTLVQWYVANVPWGSTMQKTELVALVGKTYKLSERSRQNAISALYQLLNETPLGSGLGIGEQIKPRKRDVGLYKAGWEDINPIAILYSLYRYAEKTERYELTLSELYEGATEGPYALFGVPKKMLGGVLKGLSAQNSNFVRVDIVRDLDNVFLNNTLKAIEVLDTV